MADVAAATAAAKENMEGGDFEASAFEALERDFQEILQELVGDKSLEHFRLEYEKLHRALKKSHESEKHLIKKCRDLNQEIVQNAVKVQTALKLSQEDQATITALKKEIERAWKMVETSHEKEQRARDTIQGLKSEISKLGRLVEQGAGLSINQENMVNQLVQEKNDLTKQRDMLEGTVTQMQQQNVDLTSRAHKLELERQEGSTELSHFRDQLEHYLEEAEKQQRRKERLDKELKELRTTLESRQSEINAKQDELGKARDSVQQVEKQLKDGKAEVERLSSRRDQLEGLKEHAKKAYSAELSAKARVADEGLDLRAQAKARQDEIDSLMHGKARLTKQLEGLKRNKVIGDTEKERLEQSRTVLRTGIGQLRAELERQTRQAESDNKVVLDLLRERDVLAKSNVRADESSKQQVELVEMRRVQADKLGKDLQRWQGELNIKLHRVHELERQRERALSDLQQAKRRCDNAQDELRTRDSQTGQLKRSISDVKAKLGQQKNLYEAVRTDKNLYSKNLVESLEEITEMKKKFRVMNHQIEQLKEEIKEKDKSFVTEHLDHKSISTETDKRKENLEKQQGKQKKCGQLVELQQQEIKKLELTIQEAEQERQNQRKEFEAVMSERNILGTQLTRRNEELALLYDKIRIQESTLQKGEVQYKLRLEDLKKNRDTIAKLKLDLYLAKQTAESTDDLSKEVYHLQRELLQERTKVKALSEELENPMNVHRWRKLEGSDPAMYELIQKVRALQKRLIAKTEEVVAKDLEIREKERLHRELAHVLEKQPGPEVLEQLEAYQETHSAKLGQMRAMLTELRTYQAQVQDYKDEIDRLARELQEVKKKFFDQKRREQQQADTQRGDTRAIHPRPAPMVRFTGGGFNLAH